MPEAAVPAVRRIACAHPDWTVEAEAIPLTPEMAAEIGTLLTQTLDAELYDWFLEPVTT